MSDFNFEIKTTGNSAVLKMMGALDENAKLDQIQIPKIDLLIIDLEDVVRMNSTGVREWIKFSNRLTPPPMVKLRKCSKAIVDQMNLIKGVIPEKGEVESFFVPFTDELGDEHKLVLYTSKENIVGQKIIHPVVKTNSGQLMQPDVIESKYFAFIFDK